MRGAIPPLPQYVFMVWCLVKHRDNFTFKHFICHPCHVELVTKILLNLILWDSFGIIPCLYIYVGVCTTSLRLVLFPSSDIRKRMPTLWAPYKYSVNCCKGKGEVVPVLAPRHEDVLGRRYSATHSLNSALIRR
jgi:hypothetical protein